MVITGTYPSSYIKEGGYSPLAPPIPTPLQTPLPCHMPLPQLSFLQLAFISAKARRVAAVLHVVDSQLKDFVFSLNNLIGLLLQPYLHSRRYHHTISRTQLLHSTFFTPFDGHAQRPAPDLRVHTCGTFYFRVGPNNYFTVNLKNLFWAGTYFTGLQI